MDFDQAMNSLGEDSGNSEIIEAINAKIVSVETDGKTRVHKVNEEAKGLRTRLRGLEDTLKTAGVEPGDELADVLSALKSNADKATGKDTELSKVATRLKTVEEMLATSEAEKAELKEKNRLKEIRNQLNRHGEQVLAPEQTFGYHISRGDFDLDESGEVVYKRGDDVFSVKNGLSEFFADYPTVVRNTGKPGAGSGGSGGKAGGKTVTEAQFRQMSPKERAPFFANGGTISD